MINYCLSTEYSMYKYTVFKFYKKKLKEIVTILVFKFRFDS